MRIGVGVTTYNRPECLAKWTEQIAKHTSWTDVIMFAAYDTDEDRKGVAFRKNECLRALQHCDHIFLFDDDCYPIKDGWVEFFIESGMNHLLFLNDSHKLTDYRFPNAPARVYANCGGVFMYMTKKCIEKVGAFNEKFTPYGFEHAEYSQRICKAGLSVHPYVMKDGTEVHLHSEDYSNPNHKSSITDEEKKQHVRNNWDKFFKEPIKDIYIPL